MSAAEVRDRTGRLLLTAGEQITDRALRVLRMWGVEEIDVEGAVDPPGPPVGHPTSAVFEGD
ncbi:MAG TPA: ABC transporter permease, partial [Methylomirabilota bacterium]|nr:ABC transporter permease [Methylomirabilota bacterium]